MDALCKGYGKRLREGFKVEAGSLGRIPAGKALPTRSCCPTQAAKITMSESKALPMKPFTDAKEVAAATKTAGLPEPGLEDRDHILILLERMAV